MIDCFMVGLVQENVSSETSLLDVDYVGQRPWRKGLSGKLTEINFILVLIVHVHAHQIYLNKLCCIYTMYVFNMLDGEAFIRGRLLFKVEINSFLENFIMDLR